MPRSMEDNELNATTAREGIMNVVAKGPKYRLQDLMQQQGNSLCADCNEVSPTWASTNWGVFICTQCAGVHRSLGVQHSFVLSCTLDEWTEDQVDFMESNGNIVVNAELEHNVPKTIEVPFEKTTDRDTREKYINAKYVDKLFCKSEGKPSRPPQRIHRANSRSPNSSPTLRDAAMVEFIGIVNVQLLSCSKLIIKDLLSSDPYCVLTIGLQSRKSTVKYKCLNPTYNEEFSFSWNGQDMLVLEVFDKDELSKDDHMGKAEIDLTFLKEKSGKTIECWYPITHRKHKDKQQGEVSLSLTFVPLV